MWWIKACLKCGGDVYEEKYPKDKNKAYICLQCGFRQDKSPRQNAVSGARAAWLAVPTEFGAIPKQEAMS